MTRTLWWLHFLVFLGTFDHRAGGACPEDCMSTQYNAQLSYARYVSKPPIGSARMEIPKRFDQSNLTNSQLESVIRLVTDWLIHIRLIDSSSWLIIFFNNWLIVWFIDLYVRCLIHWLIHSLTVWFLCLPLVDMNLPWFLGTTLSISFSSSLNWGLKTSDKHLHTISTS